MRQLFSFGQLLYQYLLSSPLGCIVATVKVVELYSMQIGLRIYEVQVFHNHKAQVLTADKGPADILHFIRNCCSAFSKKQLDDGQAKIVRFEPSADSKNSAHGVVRYGKYGYGSQVADRKSGVIQHTRTVDQADMIPLYYRFWLAEGKSYGLVGLQSFGAQISAFSIFRSLTEFQISRVKRDEEDKVLRASIEADAAEKISDFKLAFKDINSNISYLIMTAVVLLSILILFAVIEAANVFFSSMVVSLTVHLVLVLTMVVKQCHLIFNAAYSG